MKKENKPKIMYYFDKYGNCYNSEYEIRMRQMVFYETDASSEKKAVKKFNKWLKTW